MMRLTFVLVVLLGNYGVFAQDTIPQPGLKWKFAAGQPFVSSPVFVNNRVICGDTAGTLYCLNAENGDLIWKFHAGGGIGTAAISTKGDICFISRDGFFYCLTREGKERWNFKTQGEKKYHIYSYADYFLSTPLVVDEMVYFGCGDSFVYALDLNTGVLRWKFGSGDVVHSNAEHAKGRIYIGSFDGFYYSLNAGTGKLVWKFKSVGQQFFPKGEFQGFSVYFNNKIFVGARDYNLYALDAEEGTGIWNKQFPKGWAMGKPVIHDSVLYVGTSDDRILLALVPGSGKVKWEANVGFNVFGGCAFLDSLCIVGTLAGELFALDKRTGAKKWKYVTNASKQNRDKYLRENNEYRPDITSVIRSGDDFLRMYFSLGAIFSTPVVSNGGIIFSCTDGNIYCLKNDRT